MLHKLFYGFLIYSVVACCSLAAAGSLGEYEYWENVNPDQTWYRPSTKVIRQVLEWQATRRPDIAKVYSIGASRNGQLIRAIRITQDPLSAASWARPAVLITGGTHGNEKAPPRALMDYIDYLLDSANSNIDAYPGSNNSIEDLLASRQLWIIPVLNPDGYDMSDRKNAAGVDINRDFENQWVLNDQTTGKDTTGPHPLSQPESWALDNAFANIGPQIFLDLHTQKQAMWQTDTASNQALYDETDGKEDRICGCDSNGVMSCKIYDPALHAGLATELPSTIVGNQLESPTPAPAPGSTRFVAKRGGDNWVLIIPVAVYDYVPDSGTGPGRYDASSVRTVADEALWVVNRQDNTTTTDISLPGLSEQNNVDGISRRYYSPYSPFDVCNDVATRSRGRSGGGKQSYGHAWQKFGSMSYLLELPRYKVSSVFTDSERWTTPYSNENRWWDSSDTEAVVQAINPDLYAPFNMLLELANNPVPAAQASNYLDVAVERLYAVEGQCLSSRVFPAVYNAHRGGVSDGASTWGNKTMQCSVNSIGDQSGHDVDIEISIVNETTGNTTRSSDSFTVSSAASRYTHELAYSFNQGNRYSVVCDVTTSGTETAPSGTVTVSNDQGCQTACSAGDCPRKCNLVAGSWQRLWHTNNQRTLSFRAVLDPQICHNGIMLPHNVNGYPVGHIPSL